MNEEKYMPSMEELIYDVDYSELEEKINKNSYSCFNAQAMLQTLFSGEPWTTYYVLYNRGDDYNEWLYVKRRAGNSQVSDFFSVSLSLETKDGHFVRDEYFEEEGFLGDNEDRVYAVYPMIERLLKYLY